MRNFKYIIIFLVFIFTVYNCSTPNANNEPKTGNVIFIHPDGSALSMWGALRLLKVGPDGMINWDKMENMGLYRGHLKNSASSSSNGGATVHAFGVKAEYDDFGINPDHPIKSLSGKDYSIMTEAKIAGKSIAIINSGHICEPGTAIFVANAVKRAMEDTISAQVIYSGADIIFSGGEVMLLPKEVVGFHGKEGIRKDGRNLINEAKELGYKIIYTRKELLEMKIDTSKVLGVFAARHTFNDLTEEKLKESGLYNYNSNAPSVAEMTEIALEILNKKNKDFLMVVEEEGTDNFSNQNNANGALEALNRADDAIELVLKYIGDNPNTLLVTAADSDAGGMQVLGLHHESEFTTPLKETSWNGAPLDGINGTKTLPFKAKPDRFGNELYFGVCWATDYDVMGGVVAKAHGMNSEYLPNNVDNTDIYKLMYRTLFGKVLK